MFCTATSDIFWVRIPFWLRFNVYMESMIHNTNVHNGNLVINILHNKWVLNVKETVVSTE